MGHTGLWSILTMMVAIACAVVTRQVILALFLGVYVGVLTVEGGHLLAALTSLIRDYLVVRLTDAYSARVDLINTDPWNSSIYFCVSRGTGSQSYSGHQRDIRSESQACISGCSVATFVVS